MKLKRRSKTPQAPQTLASQCRRVRTPQGRIAHLTHPVLGVLCRQRGAETKAEAGLPECRLCKAELERLTAAASGPAGKARAS